MSARSPIDEQHLLSLRSRVALSVARRLVKTAELTTFGVLVNVDYILSRGARGPDDHEQCIAQLRQVARSINESTKEQKSEKKDWLFAIARGPPYRKDDVWPVILTASNEEILKKAVARMNTRFLGRVKVSEGEFDLDEGSVIWLGQIAEAGNAELDKALLWEVVRRASLSLIPDPSVPPPGARSATKLVAYAQMRIERLSVNEALKELQDRSYSSPIVLIDIRTAVQRSVHGIIPSAIYINRVFLEFALDPQSSERLPFVDEHKYSIRPIVFDQDGSASSLASASLYDLGLLQATDIIGGYDAWKKAGLPTASDYS